MKKRHLRFIGPSFPVPTKPFYEETIRDIENFEKKHPKKIIKYVERCLE